MLVDLPEGWERSPENPYAKIYDEYPIAPATRLDVGMYSGVAEWALEYLIADAHPYDPMFFKGTQEERMKNVREHYEQDRPEDYGVCDYPAQVVERWPAITADPRPFVILFTEIRRADEPSQGGWRWHKWGRYIGSHEPQCEYLYDEEGIDAVWIFGVLHLRENAHA